MHTYTHTCNWIRQLGTKDIAGVQARERKRENERDITHQEEASVYCVCVCVREIWTARMSRQLPGGLALDTESSHKRVHTKRACINGHTEGGSRTRSACRAPARDFEKGAKQRSSWVGKHALEFNSQSKYCSRSVCFFCRSQAPSAAI